LNLMRVMPPKGGPSRTGSFSAMRFHRMAFLLIAKESRKAGKDPTGFTELTK
jgi:hypothetical protein